MKIGLEIINWAWEPKSETNTQKMVEPSLVYETYVYGVVGDTLVVIARLVIEGGKGMLRAAKNCSRGMIVRFFIVGGARKECLA